MNGIDELLGEGPLPMSPLDNPQVRQAFDVFRLAYVSFIRARGDWEVDAAIFAEARNELIVAIEAAVRAEYTPLVGAVREYQMSRQEWFDGDEEISRRYEQAKDLLAVIPLPPRGGA